MYNENAAFFQLQAAGCRLSQKCFKFLRLRLRHIINMKMKCDCDSENGMCLCELRMLYTVQTDFTASTDLYMNTAESEILLERNFHTHPPHPNSGSGPALPEMLCTSKGCQGKPSKKKEPVQYLTNSCRCQTGQPFVAMQFQHHAKFSQNCRIHMQSDRLAARLANLAWP